VTTTCVYQPTGSSEMCCVMQV